MSDNKKEHFSFIQENTHIDANYMVLLQRMTLETNDSATPTNNDIAVNDNPATPSKVTVGKLNAEDHRNATIRQIFVWLPITLGVILYFVVIALVDMPIQKNSILYAKYGTMKTGQGSQ